MSWKERVFASLPSLLVLLGAFGVVITNEAWVAVIALAGAWLLPAPVNVSRETLSSDEHYSSQWGKDNLPPLSNVSRETLEGPKDESVEEFRSRIKNAADVTAPCVVMHGSAEPHVLGCDGWTSELH